MRLKLVSSSSQRDQTTIHKSFPSLSESTRNLYWLSKGSNDTRPFLCPSQQFSKNPHSRARGLIPASIIQIVAGACLTKYCSICGVTCGFQSIHSEGIHIPETSAPQVPIPAIKRRLLASSTVSTRSGSHHSLINQTPMRLWRKYRQVPLQNTAILA